MFKFVHFLFFALGVVCVTALGTPVSPTERELSNAARLVRGLPPRSPKFGRFLPGRRTPTIDARAPNSSPLPPLSGIIKVTRADNGGEVGYVSKSFVNPATRRFGVTSDQGSALGAAFTPGTNPLEITETNPPDSHTFLGAVVGPASDSDDLSTGSPNYGAITSTSHTAAGAPPSPVGNSYSSQNSESTIWNYDTVTNELTATWINSDSVAAPTTLWYLPGSAALLLVGDATAFNNVFPGGYAVKWTVI